MKSQQKNWLKKVNKTKFYSEFYDAYVIAYVNPYPSKTKQKCQKKVNEKWNSIKNDASFSIKAQDWINDLKPIAVEKKGAMIYYWAWETNTSGKKKDKSGAVELLFPLEIHFQLWNSIKIR